MRSLEYRRPASVEQAIELLAPENRRAKVLAGGTDLVIALRDEAVRADMLVDVKGIPQLRQVREENGSIVVGAVVTFAEIAAHPLLLARVAALSQAASQVGSPQIRNAGTVGGNIANGSPAADVVVPLVALDASVFLASVRGSRVAPLADILQARPGEVNIGRDELIVQVAFAAPAPGTTSAFAKLGRRNALSIARLSCAVFGRVAEDGTVQQIALAVGAAGPHPFRMRAVESMVAGSRLTPQLEQEVLEACSAEIARVLGSRASMPYKREAIKGVVWEALENCFSGGQRVGG